MFSRHVTAGWLFTANVLVLRRSNLTHDSIQRGKYRLVHALLIMRLVAEGPTLVAEGWRLEPWVLAKMFAGDRV